MLLGVVSRGELGYWDRKRGFLEGRGCVVVDHKTDVGIDKRLGCWGRLMV